MSRVGDPIVELVFAQYPAHHEALPARRDRVDGLLSAQVLDRPWAATIARLRCLRSPFWGWLPFSGGHDPRSFDVVLTQSGRTRLKAGSRTHLERVREQFLDRLPDAQLQQLNEIWRSGWL